MKTGNNVGYMVLVECTTGWGRVISSDHDLSLLSRKQARDFKNVAKSRFPEFNYRIAKVTLDK